MIGGYAGQNALAAFGLRFSKKNLAITFISSRTLPVSSLRLTRLVTIAHQG
jgi:hypothetical protein